VGRCLTRIFSPFWPCNFDEKACVVNLVIL
jgi:hypothetical protein